MKNVQHDDDCTSLVQDTESSRNILKTNHEFSIVAGSKINPGLNRVDIS